MPYSLPADVRNALAPGVWPVPTGQTAPKTGTAADLSDPQLADAIADADSLIDSYLSPYYVTPVAQDPNTGRLPSEVTAWSRNVAAYNATLTYRRGKDLAATDPVALRYAQTMQTLQQVLNGKIRLRNVPTLEGDIGGASVGQVINPYVGSMFGLDDFGIGTSNQFGPWPGHWVGP